MAFDLPGAKKENPTDQIEINQQGSEQKTAAVESTEDNVKITKISPPDRGVLAEFQDKQETKVREEKKIDQSDTKSLPDMKSLPETKSLPDAKNITGSDEAAEEKERIAAGFNLRQHGYGMPARCGMASELSQRLTELLNKKG